MANQTESLDEVTRELPPSRLADDEFWRTLGSRARRRVLAHLFERGETTVDELAEVLCGWEAAEETPVGPDRYRRHRIGLVHSHLPTLADAGLVDYDRDEGRVAPAEVEPATRDLIEASVEAESG